MVALLENSALVLGLVIAAHTVYSIVHNHIIEDRKRHALLGGLRLQIKAFVRLARVMADRAERVRKRHFGDKLDDLMLPGDLDEETQKDLDWILARVDHVLTVRQHWEIEKVAPFLRKKQRDAFLELLDTYNLYCDRLDIRAREFRVAPQAHGALARLIACTSVDLPPSLREAAASFEASIRHAVHPAELSKPPAG